MASAASLTGLALARRSADSRPGKSDNKSGVRNEEAIARPSRKSPRVGPPDFLAEILWKYSATIPGHRDSFLQAIDLT
jgi:hypothetical protein